jgi:hypothetical protein
MFKKHIVVVILLGEDDLYLGHEVYVFSGKVSEDELKACTELAMSRNLEAVRASASVTPA